MPHIDGSRERRGSQGRIADSVVDQHQPFVRRNITFPPELDRRLTQYAADEERAMSWVVQKAVDEWLKSKGY